MNQDLQTPDEVLQPSALEAIERAQVDVQVATAHRFPRSVKLFRERAMAMATMDQETAESCCYVRPVGKKMVNGRWQNEYAEGASIRLAEIVAASYGNLRVASRIVEQTARYVKCEGVAHDLESNYAGKSESFEPTVTKDGKPYSEGMRAVVAKAALAKAYRDAVFKVVPRALCKPVYEQAKKVAAGEGETIARRTLKAQAWLATIRVSDERVFAALGIKQWNDVTDDILNILTGLRTAIKDGDTTVDEAFPHVVRGPEFHDEMPMDKPGAPSPADGIAQKTVKPAKSAGFAEAPRMPQDASEASDPDQDTLPATKVAGAKRQEASAPPAAVAEPLKPRPGESQELTQLRTLMERDGVTEQQIVAWCTAKRLLNPERGQKAVADMSMRKIVDITRSWGNPGMIEEIKKA